MNEPRRPDRQDLRKFGITLGLILAGLFGLALPLLRKTDVPRWPWFVAASLVLAAIAMPARLGGIYRAWMRLGNVLGKANARIVLGLVWCLVMVPTAFVLRRFRRDPLERQFDQRAESYRVASSHLDPKNMEEPY